MDKEIELFVRLKYTIATNSDQWYELRDSYPAEVKCIMAEKWSIDQEFYRQSMNNQQQWDMYLQWLLEELCEYESKQNE